MTSAKIILFTRLFYFVCFFRLAGTDANGFPLREEFAKSCFETLLQFSFVNGTAEVDQHVEQPGRLTLFGLVSINNNSIHSCIYSFTKHIYVWKHENSVKEIAPAQAFFLSKVDHISLKGMSVFFSCTLLSSFSCSSLPLSLSFAFIYRLE